MMLLMLLLLNIYEFGWTNVLTAVLCGGLCWGLSVAIVWLTISKVESDIADTLMHVDMLASGKKSKPSSKHVLGLNHVIQTVENCLGCSSKLQQKLVLEKRELDIKLRIAEAEQQHLSAILDSLNDAVVVTDSFNEIAIANTAASELFHFDNETGRHLSVDDVIDDCALSTLIKDTREGRCNYKRRLEQRVVRGGSESIYDVTMTSVEHCKNHDAATSTEEEYPNAGVVTILRDITKEREIAETKSDFVSNVSHELRTPLSSIKAYMEMLIDGEAQDEQTRVEFYNIIQGETNRLSRLIDNILNISRIESGVVRVQREHIGLSAIVSEAIGIMLPQARAKRISIIEVPSPDYCRVYADRDMILQCTLNLLSNAIKYTSNEGHVTVAINLDEQLQVVRVSVSDTGVGIPDGDIPHLFDKFYRVADHKNLAKGTGLGLNLVRHVIETVHGGQVNVESEVNHGSTFTFALPIAEN